MDITPRCPRCGEPPRYRRTVHVVKLGVRFEDGKMTRTGEKRIGEVVPGFTTEWQCGGEHAWTDGDGAV